MRLGLIPDSQQQSFDTDIFVNLIPMDPGPSPTDFIVSKKAFRTTLVLI